jgi:hypothetical protein
MESTADIAIAGGLVLGAAAFLWWRFAAAPRPPPCAPDPKAQPPVILGARLAKGLAGRKAK